MFLGFGQEEYLCDMNGDNGLLYGALRTAVEQRFGRKVAVTTDFENLSAHIMECTSAYISPITLRRFWSDKPYACYNVSPRRGTLNILSRYVGLNDWEAFVAIGDSDARNSGSDYIFNNDLSAESLREGTLLELVWSPARVVVIRYMGNSMFDVVESINSKLQPGDRFRGELFIEGEPLLLTGLVRNGGEPVKFLCGKQGGIRFRILDAKGI